MARCAMPGIDLPSSNFPRYTCPEVSSNVTTWPCIPQQISDYVPKGALQKTDLCLIEQLDGNSDRGGEFTHGGCSVEKKRDMRSKDGDQRQWVSREDKCRIATRGERGLVEWCCARCLRDWRGQFLMADRSPRLVYLVWRWMDG